MDHKKTIKKILATILLACVSTSFAADVKKTIQVSATILPYCYIKMEGGEAKNICPGYKTEMSRATVTKTETSITFTY